MQRIVHDDVVSLKVDEGLRGAHLITESKPSNDFSRPAQLLIVIQTKDRVIQLETSGPNKNKLGSIEATMAMVDMICTSKSSLVYAHKLGNDSIINMISFDSKNSSSQETKDKDK